MTFDLVQRIVIWLIPLIFAITLHEVAHGWVAKCFGDQTANMLGRITLNPVRHIDLVGTIIIPVVLLLLSGGRFTFGYAKPVPIDPRNFRHPRRDMAIVALAGPVSNLIMAILWGVIAKLATTLSGNNPTLSQILFAFGVAGVQINLVLGILNLIPIPPLDGSRVVSSCLSNKASLWYNSLERYGFWILLLLIATGALGQFLWPIITTCFNLIFNLLGIQ